MNNLTVIGNTCKEVVTITKEKTFFSSVVVAINYRYKKEKRSFFVECIFFEKLSSLIQSLNITKGSLLFVSGELMVEEWQGDDGRTHKNLKMLVGSFSIIKRNEEKENNNENNTIGNIENFKTITADEMPF